MTCEREEKEMRGREENVACEREKSKREKGE